MRDVPEGFASTGFLGVGDPLEPAGDSSLPPLPYSGQALERISELFRPEHRVVLKRERATQEALRRQPLGRFRFVHFATHGTPDRERPRLVGLRLSPDAGGAPDILDLEDVLPLELSAELVVLSACQSGLGELLPGEGLVGLTRAFLHAGARSVMVSLWDVSDKATAEFMQRFYEALDGRTVVQALHEAKLSFLRSDRAALRQPYRWAPFVLVGDPGAMAVRLNPEAEMAKHTGNPGS
jgi:CHAT domain-containing protein